AAREPRRLRGLSEAGPAGGGARGSRVQGRRPRDRGGGQREPDLSPQLPERLPLLLPPSQVHGAGRHERGGPPWAPPRLRHAPAASPRGERPAAEPRVDPARQARRLPARRLLSALSESLRAVARPRALGDHGGGLSPVKRGQPALRLKRGHDAARAHPWVFQGAVADASDVEPGAAITVVDTGGRFIGRGFYNPKPALCCRILTWTDEPLDAAFFQRRLEAAPGLRAHGPPQAAPTLCRPASCP